MKLAVLIFCTTLCCISASVSAVDVSTHHGPIKQNETLNIPHPESIIVINPRQTLSQASSQIDTYEKEVRRPKVQHEELTPLSEAPRDPDLVTGITAVPKTSESNLLLLEEIKQVLVVEDQQIAQAKLPETEPAESKKEGTSGQPMFRYSYEISVVDDDNVRLAQNDVDIREDTIVSAAIKAIGEKSIDSLTSWNYGGSLTYNSFDTFDELNNYEFEVNTRYRFALTPGPTSTIYSLGAKIGGLEFDSEMRDSTVFFLSAELNKWITNSISMTAGLGFSQRESVSEVFDTSESRIFINFDAGFSQADLIYTTLALFTGDRVSSATPTLGIVNASDAIEPDDAFGGVAANQFAYRIDAETVLFTLGYNRILTQGLSVDLSARYVDSEAREDDEITYDRTILRASLIGRF